MSAATLRRPLAFVTCVGVGTSVALASTLVSLFLALVVFAGALVTLQRRRLNLALWAGVALSAPLNAVRLAPNVTLTDALLLAALVTTLPDLASRPRRRVIPSGLFAALVVVVAAGLLGTFFAANVNSSLVNLVKIVLAAGGTTFAIASWDPGSERLRQFAWLYLGGAIANVSAALVASRVLGRGQGLTTHPNHFGLLCMLASGIAIGLVLSSRGRARRAAVAGLALVIGGVVMSGSRTALLALLVTVVFTAVASGRMRLMVASGVFVLLAGLAAAAGLVHIPDSSAVSRLQGGGGVDVSDARRREQLSEALQHLRSHPLTGQGFEFALAAHDIYIQALVVGGPIALAGFLWAVATIVRTGTSAVRAGRRNRDALLLSGLVGSYVGYVAAGPTHNVVWDRYLWVYVGVLLTLASTIKRDRVAEEDNQDPAIAAV